jgi:hypothetical protein
MIAVGSNVFYRQIGESFDETWSGDSTAAGGVATLTVRGTSPAVDLISGNGHGMRPTRGDLCRHDFEWYR